MQLIAIATNGFREASRNRVTIVIFAFAAVLVFSATVALEFTVATFDRVMTDVGLGVLSFISVILAVFLGSGLIPREIERRTIFMVVSRPVSRATFVVGRFLGNLLTVYVLTLAMAAVLAIQFSLQRVTMTQSMGAVVAGLLAEVALLSAITVFFSVWSSQIVTVVSTIGLYFLGHAANDLYGMATHAKSEAMKTVGLALYYVLPNLDRLDYKAQATYGEAVGLAQLGGSLVYAVGYSAVLIAAACLLFERRDFK
jgi:Cu-processing system permease protein